jgi:hypothetical protein
MSHDLNENENSCSRIYCRLGLEPSNRILLKNITHTSLFTGINSDTENNKLKITFYQISDEV